MGFDDAREGWARLAVRDDGVGLEDAIQEGDPTGYGLSLVQRLAQHIGAELRCSSHEVEKGSVWEIRFPFSVRSEEDGPEALQVDKGTAPHFEEEVSLVVEGLPQPVS